MACLSVQAVAFLLAMAAIVLAITTWAAPSKAYGPLLRTSQRKWGSALARRGGRVVCTDTRRLSFVRQIPSNGEEHEKNSDDDPNIGAEH